MIAGMTPELKSDAYVFCTAGDHVFVPAERADEAMTVLRALQASA